MPGTLSTTARDIQWADERPLPKLYQAYSFLKARKTHWGTAADALNWEEAEKLPPKVNYVQYHIRVLIVGREAWS
eukprot:2872987-Prorocentrum_lima.AAC.1